MVEYIISDFLKIRGSGNVKSEVPETSDFECYNCIVTQGSSSDSFVLTPSSSPVPVISLAVSSASVSYGTSVTLTATVTLSGSAVSGETVTFKDGSTSLGTGTTNSSGVATLSTSSLSVGSHSVTASYDGQTSSSKSITVTKITSTISLSAASSTVTYGNSVSLSGTLSVGSGCSVKIYQGSSLIDTVSTGSGGAFSKSVSGLSVGSYNFKAVYDGDTTHSDVTSSNVSVTVSKITSTITLATSSSTVTVGDTFTLSGTLNAGTGCTVKVYVDSTQMDTVTTTTGGAFSKTVTASNVGTYSFTAVFDGNSNYTNVTSSAVSVTISSVPTPTPASITLVSSKDILSYYDSEYTVLSATVLDSSDNPVSGETVEFFNGSTSMGTATTTASGVASKAYYAAGSGDVSFTAEVRSLVSEIYVIHDYYYRNTTKYSTSDTNLNIPLPSDGFILEYELYVSTRSNSMPYLTVGYPTTDTSSNRVLIGQYARAGGNGIITYAPTQTNHSYGTDTTLNATNTIHFEYDGSDYKYKLNTGNSMTVSKVSSIPMTYIRSITGSGTSSSYIQNITVIKL